MTCAIESNTQTGRHTHAHARTHTHIHTQMYKPLAIGKILHVCLKTDVFNENRPLLCMKLSFWIFSTCSSTGGLRARSGPQGGLIRPASEFQKAEKNN